MRQSFMRGWHKKGGLCTVHGTHLQKLLHAFTHGAERFNDSFA